MADKELKPWEVETAPSDVDVETGVAMVGNYPLNDRLRAEALVEAKRKTDPDKLISDELIAHTAERLANEAADTKAAPSDAE